MAQNVRLKLRGYTLLELALVTVIIGLLAYFMMDFMVAFTGKEKQEAAQRTAELASDQLKGYVIGHDGRLPGEGPDNTLPASLNSLTDPWGQKMMYWRADELVGVPVDGVNTTDMTIRIFTDFGDLPTNLAADEYTTGTPLPADAQEITNVAYAVLSSGPNLTSEFVVSNGSLHINVLKPGTHDDTTASDFDDLFHYVTLGELRTTFAATGQTGEDAGGTPTDGTGADTAIYLGGDGEVSPGGDILNDPTYTGSGVTGASTDVGDGTALSFDGSTSGTDGVINLTTNSDDYAYQTFTILNWFKTADTYDPTDTNAFGVFTSRQNSTSDRNWWITIWGGGFDGQTRPGRTDSPEPGDIAFKASVTSGTSWFMYTSGENYADQAWHFVAVSVRDNGDGTYTGELYIDGAVMDTQPLPTRPPMTRSPENGSGYTLYIGGGTYNSNRRFEGLMDEFTIAGPTPMSATEVDNYYQTNKGDYGH